MESKKKDDARTNKKISRRDFLRNASEKGLALGLVGIGTLTGLDALLNRQELS